MSTRRTSFGKVERERAKKTKAAAKREQRQIRSSGEGALDEDQPVAEVEAVAAGESTAELLAKIEQLHQRFDAGVLDYEDFETQKSDLLGRLRLD